MRGIITIIICHIPRHLQLKLRYHAVLVGMICIVESCDIISSAVGFDIYGETSKSTGAAEFAVAERERTETAVEELLSGGKAESLIALYTYLPDLVAMYKISSPSDTSKEMDELVKSVRIASQILSVSHLCGLEAAKPLFASLPVWNSTSYMHFYSSFPWQSLDLVGRVCLMVAGRPYASTHDIQRILNWEGLDGAPAEMAIDGYITALIINPEKFISVIRTMPVKSQREIAEMMAIPLQGVTDDETAQIKRVLYAIKERHNMQCEYTKVMYRILAPRKESSGDNGDSNE